MTIFEALSVVGLFAGPVTAVIITLWAQKRFDRSQRRLALARGLLISQVDHSQPEWSANIRQIPVEFRHSQGVMDTWREYIEAVNFHPSPENKQTHDSKIHGKKLDLLFQVSVATKLGLSESDIRNSSYLAQGYTDRQQLAINADAALVRIAAALENNGTAN